MLVGIPTFAGDFKGNGGSSVQCSGKPLQILDFFEMPWPLQLGPPNLSAEAKSEIYLQRLAAFSPRRADLYRLWFQRFQSEAVFLDGIPIDKIPDTDFTPPPGCVLVQVVNQNPALLPPGKHYLVDSELWRELSTDQKVGLIFHELLYRESKAKNSIQIRKLNAAIAGHQIRRYTPEQMTQKLKLAELPWAEAQGLMFSLEEKFSFDKKGFLRTAMPISRSSFKLRDFKFELRSNPVEFYDNGSIQKIRFFGVLPVLVDDRRVNFENYEGDQVYLQFYPDGRVKEGPLTWHQNWILSSPTYSLTYRYLGYDPSGLIQFVGTTSGTVGVKGQTVRVMDRSTVQFFKNRLVKEFSWGGGDRDRLQIWGQQVLPKYSTPIILNEDGSVFSFVAGEAGRLKLPNGSFRNFKKGDLVKVQSDQ